MPERGSVSAQEVIHCRKICVASEPLSPYIGTMGTLVICVEDSSKDAELFNRALLQMRPDCRLLHFRDAAAAQSFLKVKSEEQKVALVVVDIMLPGMRGDELIPWIRARPHLKEIPIIALSGRLAFRTVEEAQAIGATSFFLKPVVYNDWIDLVYNLQDYCLS
jgi:CheY-like chemotaxis protein